jgi:hypothetical protein
MLFLHSISHYTRKYVNTAATEEKEATTDSPLQPHLHRQWHILKAMAACKNDENNVKK